MFFEAAKPVIIPFVLHLLLKFVFIFASIATALCLAMSHVLFLYVLLSRSWTLWARKKMNFWQIAAVLLAAATLVARIIEARYTPFVLHFTIKDVQFGGHLVATYSGASVIMVLAGACFTFIFCKAFELWIEEMEEKHEDWAKPPEPQKELMIDGFLPPKPPEPK